MNQPTLTRDETSFLGPLSQPAGGTHSHLDWERVRFLHRAGLKLRIAYQGQTNSIFFRRETELDDFLRTWSESMLAGG